jgi:Mrp family chromosome partitioning ATPase
VSLIQKAAQQLAADRVEVRPASRPLPASAPAAPIAPAAAAPAPAAPRPCAAVQPAAAPPAVTAITIDDAALARAGCVTPATHRSRLGEEMRVVVRRLLRKWGERPDAADAPRTLLVTSAEPAEGKTFTAANLALCFALEGIPVTLVDGDLFRPTLPGRLGIAPGPGLAELLRSPGQAPEGLLLRDARLGLTLLRAGRELDDAAQLPRADLLRDVLQRLVQRQPRGVVVIDSPPVLASSMAPVLAEAVTSVLMVVRANSTGEAALDAALGLLEAAPDIALLLNQTAAHAAEHNFGSYYGPATEAPAAPAAGE